MTMPTEAGKWSRNLSEEVINESNRSRLIEKQRQILETKRTRQHQATITSTRPKSARSLRPASSLSRSSEKLLDNRDTPSLEGMVNPISMNPDDEDDFGTDGDYDIRRSIGLRSRASNKRSSSPSPSMSPIDQGSMASKGRTLSSLSTTATIGTTSSANIIGLQSRAHSSIRSVGAKSASSSYEDLKDDVETIRSMDLNENRIELNPLKTILNTYELLLFATQPVSPRKTYQCIIMRDKRGIDRSFYPTYYIYLQSIIDKPNEEETDPLDGNDSIASPVNSEKDLSPMESRSSTIKTDHTNLSNHNTNSSSNLIINTNGNLNSLGPNRRQVFLLGGRRRKKSKTYLISNDPFDITRDNCIAKLKSNVLGTLFSAIRILNERQRYEISSVIYETNVLGFKGPRKMTVIMPKSDEVCPFPNSSLLDLWKADPTNKSLISLKNKTPVWNEDTQSYVLNFHGRVTQPSVKNFQLVVARRTDDNGDIDEIIYTGNSNQTSLNTGGSSSSAGVNKGAREKSSSRPSTPPIFFPTNPAPNSIGSVGPIDDDIAMQFGRISDKEFTCDVTYPLSILQAFCIALSSFDSKLACE